MCLYSRQQSTQTVFKKMWVIGWAIKFHSSRDNNLLLLKKNTYLQQNSHCLNCTNANTNAYPANSTLRCQNLSNRCCDFTLLAVTRTTHFHLQSQLLFNFCIKINYNLIISFNILRSGPISSPSCNSQLALLLCRQPALLHVYEQQDSFLFPATCTLRKTHYVSLNHAIAVYIGRQLSDQPITQITERATGNLPGQLSLREYSPGRIFSCPWCSLEICLCLCLSECALTSTWHSSIFWESLDQLFPIESTNQWVDIT